MMRPRPVSSRSVYGPSIYAPITFRQNGCAATLASSSSIAHTLPAVRAHDVELGETDLTAPMANRRQDKREPRRMAIDTDQAGVSIRLGPAVIEPRVLVPSGRIHVAAELAEIVQVELAQVPEH